MARTTNRAGGHKIESAPKPTPNNARPARPSDPATGAAHPTSRKPNPPTAGHGNGGSK